jgi:hypothetical protein
MGTRAAFFDRDRASDRAESRSFGLAIAGLVLSILLQTLMFAFYMGRLSARVDSVERNTQQLLQLQLDKSAYREGEK